MKRFIHVGTGGWGRYWSRTVIPHLIELGVAEPVAAVDVNPANLANAREGYGIDEGRCYTDPVKTFAERYLRERGLRPTTVHNYQGLLATRINPYFAEMPLKNVTLSEIKAWRASLNPKTEATNAAAYRLLRSRSRPPRKKS